MVLVTHDVDEALSLGERILVLDDGRIILDHRPRTPLTHQSRPDERRLLLSALGVDEAATALREVPA